MKKLKIEDGLLLTDMELMFKEQVLLLKRVLVDTANESDHKCRQANTKV